MRLTTRLSDGLPTTFDALMALHALRPIGDGVDLENATKVMDLLAVVNAPTADQSDYLHTLALLVDAYESAHRPVDRTTVSGLDKLRYLLDANGMTGADLGRLLGVVPSLASMILAGHRAITVEHARELAERFAVKPAAFLDL